jgi:tryptophan synthase alpha chain
MTTNSIDTVFSLLRAQGRKAFIPFVTAGDPDLAMTHQVAHCLATAGAHLIEIGFPYSDPIADGPVIQASYTRALAAGLRLDDIFRWASKLTQSALFGAGGTPLVAMVSYTLVDRRGAEQFLKQAGSAGFAGLIIPDLPIDESETLVRLAASRNLKLIQLVTPTTPRERAARIARASTGFLYCVSVTGITGERERLPEDLSEQIRWLRGQTDLPLCIGFGISKPEHVARLRGLADGIIVGSALVRRLEQVAVHSREEAAHEIASLARELAGVLNP